MLKKTVYIFSFYLLFGAGFLLAADKSPRLLGVDVSIYQSKVDWEQVKKAGVSFSIVRATMGEEGIDADFHKRWAEARQDGLVRGAYHFFHGKEDAALQAKHFVKTVVLKKGDLPLIVDIERTPENKQLSAKVLSQKLRTFVDIVYQKTGIRPIIYTSPKFWNDSFDESFGEHPLWVAEYEVDAPHATKGWKGWTFWQHTEKGKMPGVDGFVDQNWFQGSVEELKALTK